MKASELRIGNLIYVNNKLRHVFGTIYKTIQHNYHEENSTYSENYENECESIPLTEEWLVKFGFEFESKDDYTNITYYQAKYKNSIKQTNIISIDSDGLLQISEEQDMINWSNLCTIKYVHQLQNLYFALTNEELNIKL